MEDTPVNDVAERLKDGMGPSALELPPGTTRWGTDLEKLAERDAQAREAVSRTPGAVLDALEPETAAAAGRDLHDFTVQTYLNLTRLHSPFIEKSREPGIDDVITALWALTVSDELVRLAIKSGGEELEGRIARFAGTISIAQLAGLATAIEQRIAAGFAPAAQMHPPKQEGGGAPLDQVSSATAPAGS